MYWVKRQRPYEVSQISRKTVEDMRLLPHRISWPWEPLLKNNIWNISLRPGPFDLSRLIKTILKLYRGKVTPEEVSWNFKEASACITFPSMAVAIPTQITCSLLSPRISSPPLTEDMALVSNIIELSCDASTGSKGFEEKVTVALSHSAINLRGYELVIQALVDKDRNEWKDLETRSLRKASGRMHLV